MTIEPTLTLKQKQALKILLDDKKITELLYGGGAGSGKSYLGCLWILIMCLKYPNTRYLIGRSKLTTLKQSTLKTFFEVCKKLNIPSTYYKYNQQNNVITFDNGSEILLKDLFSYPSDPDFDSLGSLEITAGFIDECSQVSEKAKNVVMSRVRYKLDEYGLTPKMFMSCNPSKNWVYNSFYKPNRDNTIEPYRMFIQALVHDNEYISKHYVSNLEKLDYASRVRLLEGKWEYSDSLSLFQYDNIIDMFNDNHSSGEFYLSCDIARLGKDSSVLIVWKGFRIIEIKEIKKQTLDLTIKDINDLITKWRISVNNVVIDEDGVGGVKDFIKGSVGIVNNSKALNDENYQNLKTQLYFKLADKVNNNEVCASVLSDEQQQRLTQELQILKRDKVENDGKVCMTTKEQIKKDIGRSPDISDAMAYRMYFELNKNKGKYFVFKL